MNQVRIGVIGLGSIGNFHTRYLAEGKIPRATLTAVCDVNRKALQAFVPRAATFTNSTDLIHSGLVDAVLIATPQSLHVDIGIDALRNGLHVLVEKPLARHLAEARRLVAAHKARRQVFAIMFNQRADPRHRWIRDAIAAGTIGSLQRVNLVMTEWFRTNAYYESADWRGTWEGEGGGILMNQYAHHLDLLQWMCGMPKRVRAFCGIGKHHPIEVEDEVTAYFEYGSGATGVFVGSTGEAPGTNRFEIAGDLGRIVLEGERIILTRNAASAARVRKTSREPMAKPAARRTTIRSPHVEELHQVLTRNFVDAIRTGAPLIAPAEQGLRSLELANAMIYSSFTGRTAELPLNARAYRSFLHKRLGTH
jgi:predicted dehydrogenase